VTYALLKIHGHAMEILTLTNETWKELGQVFSKQQEIDHWQGKSHGWIAISDFGFETYDQLIHAATWWTLDCSQTVSSKFICAWSEKIHDATPAAK
jgi:hypothetical protein